MRRSPHSRVAVTIPRDVVAAADRLASALDRPRSWVVAEALRRFAATPSGPSEGTDAASVGGIGPSRLAQLEADLRLTPAQRVRATEQTARATRRRRRGSAQRVIAFERYEDYVEWKRLDALLG
jgi:hypothetical protein